jgi:hypothetical protein
MKILFLLMCFTLSGALFALGQTDSGHQPLVKTEQNKSPEAEPGQIPEEAFTVTGGFEEVDVSSCDPALLEFIEEVTDLPENEGGGSGTEVIRVFRQIVQGYKFIICGKLAGGDLVIFVIHFNLSGEFYLLEKYRDTKIFTFFASSFLKM